ncbi:hypothetical protein AYO47_01420 [Planctomyces sp. SCGC AG-212-M04]|nr:hypothetical protein AYO47_01420 [Planctomyces sp. SCGC AG-212-M04]
MASKDSEVVDAISVFVTGFCAGKSRTHPYEASLIDGLWVMRDAPRRNPKDYRKEEWVAWKREPAEVDALARGKSRGRFFVCVVTDSDEEQQRVKAGYKQLGYRLLATEPLFRHDLERIPRASSPAEIVRITTPELARDLAVVTRTRPIPQSLMEDDAPIRQYVAMMDGKIVGRVQSVDAERSTWCNNLHVDERFRRKGIGRGLLARMLQDDRKRGFAASVLLASHTGALLYPHVGYRQLGVLSIYAPPRRRRS